MATYNEQLQHIWRLYEERNGHVPATIRDAVVWGHKEGLIAPPEVDPYDRLVEDMARALREEYRTDKKGRRYRANHAVRITKGGVQYTFWAIMDYAPRGHMEKAFAQRRNQIVGDCFQLKTDVDVYNDAHTEEPPLPLILDFADDVKELEDDPGEGAA
jgi:hypothetical protein